MSGIHLPKPLLTAIGRRARALGISRNRLIVRALERELASGSDWSPGFFERLAAVDPGIAPAVDEMLAAIRGEPVITRNPEVMGGTAVFAGTRVPVATLLDNLAAGDSINDFLAGFPMVSREQVIRFLEQAKERATTR